MNIRKNPYFGPKKRPILKKKWLAVGLLLLLGWYIIGFYNNLRPYILAYARMNAESLMSTIANEALRKSLAEFEKNTEELVQYYYDDAGNIVACGVDTVGISNLSVDILSAMDDYFSQHDYLEFDVPVGAALGETVFIGWWPDIPFKVRLIGNADISYDRAFESVGINQVNHRVWLELKFTIQVSAPLVNDIMDSSRTLMLVDRTFSGDVPLIFME
ncbi:MAG: hypothetical protein IJ315_10245 [Firmicutes bacterium]|nr:hypothetical protein [Bacillota bacterium]